MMICIENVRGLPALMIAAIVVIGIMICGIYYLHKKTLRMYMDTMKQNPEQIMRERR